MIFDLHNDLPTAKLSATERIRLLTGTVETVVYAFWTSELAEPLKFIADGMRELGGTIPFAIEDLWFVNESNIDAVCSLRPVYCSLTHNGRNSLAGGALENGRLTSL